MADSFNPGQKDYEDKTNFDPIEIARSEGRGTASDKPVGTDIAAAENAEGGYVNNFKGYNTPGKPSATKLISNLKKKGPLISIIGLLVGGGAGIGLLLSPSLLIVHLKEVFVGHLNDAQPALNIRTNKMLWKKASAIAKGFDFPKYGICDVKCKFGTVSESMKSNLEKPGSKFKVEFNERSIDGKKRYSIKSFTYDGKTVTDAEGFKKLMNDPAAASDFKKHFNSRTAYFLNSKFGLMLREKLGLNKLAKISGDTLDKAKASIRKSLGLEGDTATKSPTASADRTAQLEAHPVYSKALSTIRSVNTKANGVAAVCTAYNVGKVTTYAIKMAKMLAFAEFAMMFLTLADQIKAGDNVTTSAVEQAGNQLTSLNTDKNSKNYGMSATDSIGYKMAAYQDTFPAASGEDERFSITPIGDVMKFIMTLLSFILAGGSATMLAASLTCKVANATSIVLSCGPELIAALVGAVETGGLSVGAGVVWCAFKVAATITAISTVIGWALGAIVGAVVKSELPILDETTSGTDVGNAIYSGSATIMGGQSATYGLKPGTQDEIKQYALDTYNERMNEVAIARYEAQSTPFDLTNQYSFLGTIANKIGLFNYSSSSFAASFTSIFSIIPRSIAALQPKALAAETDANTKSALYGSCNDWALKQLGVGADALCNPSYVMSNDEMNTKEIDTTLDYMINNKYIDSTTGDPISGTEYAKYVQYCANRRDPIGETSMALEEDDYLWAVGIKCVDNNDMMSNFRTYTMDLSINETMEEYAY